MTNDPKFCEFCSAPLVEGANFCEACGQKVRSIQATPEQATPEPAPQPPPEDELMLLAPQPDSQPEPTPEPEQPHKSLSADEIEQAFTAQPPLVPPAITTPPSQVFPPRQPTFTPPPSPPKRSKTVPILLGVGGCLTLLCIAAVIIGVIFFINSSPTSNIGDSGVTPRITQIVVVSTEQPLPTMAPAPTMAPTQPEAVQLPTESAASPTNLPAMDESWPEGIGQQLVGNYFSDDFTTKKFEWAEVDDEIRTWGVQDEHFTLHLKKPDYSIWAYLPIEFTPTTITFDAAVQPGFDEGGYGVLCHYQDQENYHFISIDPLNKEYAIGFVKNDEYFSLLSEDWVPSIHLKDSPHAINNLIIICEADSILLMVNNELEAQVDMETATSGQTAIYGETWEDTPAEGFKVLFDNFFAYIPAQ